MNKRMGWLVIGGMMVAGVSFAQAPAPKFTAGEQKIVDGLNDVLKRLPNEIQDPYSVGNLDPVALVAGIKQDHPDLDLAKCSLVGGAKSLGDTEIFIGKTGFSDDELKRVENGTPQGMLAFVVYNRITQPPGTTTTTEERGTVDKYKTWKRAQRERVKQQQELGMTVKSLRIAYQSFSLVWGVTREEILKFARKDLGLSESQVEFVEAMQLEDGTLSSLLTQGVSKVPIKGELVAIYIGLNCDKDAEKPAEVIIDVETTIKHR